MSAKRLFAAVALAVCVTSCVSIHIPFTPAFSRPPQVAREWVDVRKTTAADTSLWVLRDNGYDGSAHIRVTADASGAARAVRTESRYGGWYFRGTLGDTANQAICFSKRLGRFGATCDGFVIDSVSGPNGPVPRLTLYGYKGEHTTANRVLVAHTVP